MKPVYRCDYCNHMGTEDEVREHEIKCDHNFNNRGCMTCKHCKTDGIKQLKCDFGVEVPEGQQILYCGKHEQGTPEIIGIMSTFMNMFGGL